MLFVIMSMLTCVGYYCYPTLNENACFAEKSFTKNLRNGFLNCLGDFIQVGKKKKLDFTRKGHIILVSIWKTAINARGLERSETPPRSVRLEPLY